METFSFSPGDSPLLISIPHVGEQIPDTLAPRMTDGGRLIGDTDWALDRLYNFSDRLGLNVIRANFSRYVIDLNRDPEGRPLYPGASNTELAPTTTFSDAPIYLPGKAPDSRELEQRKAAYWQPYHDKLKRTLEQIHDRHGIALLFDCHSIRSRVPRFFEGKLPDLNLGTADGSSCASDLRTTLEQSLAGSGRYSLAIDGRFKGGYITRHYGDPDANIHAFQLEHATSIYMDEGEISEWREELAQEARPHLEQMLKAALNWAAEQVR
jgi:N-formylglutamate amidohydrolase